jgi:hypothetical protein
MFTAVLILVIAYLAACYIYGGMILAARFRERRTTRALIGNRSPVIAEVRPAAEHRTAA